MNTNSGGLRSRLEGFEIDEPGVTLPFTARLARENGWTLAFAARVVREYKRFLYLSTAAGHPVSPAEDVDQAWHLHMVYTRSYWDRLCGDILGRPLHHEPTLGGAAEGAKFRDWYGRTLESYAREFGEQPPADIWPPVEKRFQSAGEGRWVDSSRYWLVPRPAWLPRLRRPVMALLMAGTATAALFVPGCRLTHVDWSPFEWRAGPFLTFYGIMFVVCLLWSARIKAHREAAFDAAEPLVPLTDPYEVAFLAGGGRRVMQAAMTRLYSAGILQVVKAGIWKRGWRLTGVVPPHLHSVESAIVATARAKDSPKGVNLRELMLAAPSSLANIENRLAAKGLRAGRTERLRARRASAIPLFLLLGIGALKVVIGGLIRGHPVGYLMLCMAITLITAVVVVAQGGFLTSSGKSMLSTLRSQWGPSGPARSAPNDIAYSVALLGTTALTGVPGMELLHRDFKSHQQTDSGTSSGGGCSSGCSSSGCGSSGCGGGGGCGGCGGGD